MDSIYFRLRSQHLVLDTCNCTAFLYPILAVELHFPTMIYYFSTLVSVPFEFHYNLVVWVIKLLIINTNRFRPYASSNGKGKSRANITTSAEDARWLCYLIVSSWIGIKVVDRILLTRSIGAKRSLFKSSESLHMENCLHGPDP